MRRLEYIDLLHDIAHTGTPPQGQATLVTQDSRKVEPGAVFVCVVGKNSDGHDYAEKALADGAGLLVTQRPLGLANEIVVQDSRKAYSLLCQAFFGHPAKKLCITAVTGTNGKTTVAYVLKSMLQQAGLRCGLIGTIHTEIADMQVPAKFTTPEAWDLNALLARMVAAGCTHVVMEASSQALEQHRVYGLQFALGIFTNLTQDHLDYHGSMQAYFEAKSILFEQCDAMLVNADDAWGQKLLVQTWGAKSFTFGLQTPNANFYAEDVQLEAGGVAFRLRLGKDGVQTPVTFAMPGEFSVYNALAVAGAAAILQVEDAVIRAALCAAKGVPGRSQVLYDGAFTVICDFAHTGDAIEKLLAALHPYVKNRLVVLFGCPGQRDREKRPLMGAVAARYGDVIVYTADNPRDEAPGQIEADTLPPLKKAAKPYYVWQNRQQAVAMALDMLQKGDVLALCGKGHEDYQVLDGETIYLSEEELVQSWLCEKGYVQP